MLMDIKCTSSQCLAHNERFIGAINIVFEMDPKIDLPEADPGHLFS